jgi:hypothetical protein
MDFAYQTYSPAAFRTAQGFVTIFLAAREVINKRDFIRHCQGDTLIVGTGSLVIRHAW